MDTKKLLATAIMAVLALSILSLSVPALSEDEENEEEEQEDESEEQEDESEEQEDESEEQEDESEEQEDESEVDEEEYEEVATEVSVKVEGKELEVEVEVEGGVDGQYDLMLDCETKPEAIEGAVVSGTLIVKDGKGEIELKTELAAGEYANCTLTFGEFSQVVAGFTVTAEVEVEEEEEETKETAEKVKKEVKEIAKEAKEAAKKARESAKDKPEFVENIDRAEKFFGKSDKAVVALKIGLESDSIESMSFGSAQLLFIKIGDKEPMFRATINILTDQPVENLTACMDGTMIGQLEVIHASEELGLTIGHMRESLTGRSITIPGVTVEIVEGVDCTGTPVLSGGV